MAERPASSSQMIAILGTIDVDPAVRDRLVASTTALQLATRHDEPGCVAYTIAADPAVAGRIQITELWASAEALDAHFAHPNFRATGDALRAEPRIGGSAVKYRIDAVDGVKDADGVATSRFWSAEG
jgi:quinol monooxygenase YgiN